ncbi:MAG TPA: hypothetical protein VFE04_09670, partial [Puia sp.]|nr:hypothetical protein [Puia sp.]
SKDHPKSTWLMNNLYLAIRRLIQLLAYIVFSRRQYVCSGITAVAQSRMPLLLFAAYNGYSYLHAIIQNSQKKNNYLK